MIKQLIVILTILISLNSCKGNSNSNYKSKSTSDYSTEISNTESKEGYPDDKYCADVKYYNQNTETHSSYRLTIEVKNNKVIELDWPNGGRLDSDHFVATSLNEKGFATFSSDKGYVYEIQIIGLVTNCFDNVPMVQQCKGITKSGKRCKHETDNKNGLCWQHQNQ